MNRDGIVLALLHAGPGSSVRRDDEGRLEVAPASRSDEGGQIVLTHDQLLERGMDALLELVA
ncbi:MULTISPECIES: hypothetical protein [Nocardiopsis]|uniref:Uncharacterized protein n=2 Tax=Nocardiopsis TaxID=2013 RepID=A0ABT4TIN7_9ACTN|nr:MULTISPECIES: hypothetical protein [Nocardiopsis]MDA2804231.1 hypothetical protein [Nocardiopsis suaedae]MDA2815298.1 hypothetical protein [Nocardiopsis endophytica]